MRFLLPTILITGLLAGTALAQMPGGKPRPNGQSGGSSTCVQDCARELARCREPGKTNGIPPHCAPDYNACVKKCK